MANDHSSATGNLVERQTGTLRLVHLSRTDAHSLHVALVEFAKTVATQVATVPW